MTLAGTLADGRVVEELALSGNGLSVRILTLGSNLCDVRLDGIEHSLTLASGNLDDYLSNFRFGGGIVGPVANRIGAARAPLQGKVISLPANEGTNCLHGGPKGLDAQIWTVEAHAPDALLLNLRLEDGEDGWPGNRRISAHWTLPAPGTLSLELTATTDAATLFAPAQHGYWRLGPGPDLTGHRLICAADRYTEVDEAKIPTGACPLVEGSPFDFRQGQPIGPETKSRIDHNLCVYAERGPIRPICTLEGPSARLNIFSTEPGLQVYDAAHFGARAVYGADGKRFAAFAGLALEPQLWPDAANHPDWASPLLLPGQTYRQVTLWEFEWR